MDGVGPLLWAPIVSICGIDTDFILVDPSPQLFPFLHLSSQMGSFVLFTLSLPTSTLLHCLPINLIRALFLPSHRYLSDLVLIHFFSLLDIYMWWVKVRIQTWERTCCICLSDPDLPHLNNVSQFHLCSWNSYNLIFLYRWIKFHRHMYHIFLSIRLWMNVSADKIFSLLWNQQW